MFVTRGRYRRVEHFGRRQTELHISVMQNQAKNSESTLQPLLCCAHTLSHAMSDRESRPDVIHGIRKASSKLIRTSRLFDVASMRNRMSILDMSKMLDKWSRELLVRAPGSGTSKPNGKQSVLGSRERYGHPLTQTAAQNTSHYC
jgi:hypothetical protein